MVPKWNISKNKKVSTLKREFGILTAQLDNNGKLLLLIYLFRHKSRPYFFSNIDMRAEANPPPPRPHERSLPGLWLSHAQNNTTRNKWHAVLGGHLPQI